jgi:hypothetical protein
MAILQVIRLITDSDHKPLDKPIILKLHEDLEPLYEVLFFHRKWNWE